MEHNSTFDLALTHFTDWVHKQALTRINNFYGPGEGLTYPGAQIEGNVTVKRGNRWTKVDVYTSGKYMVDKDGTIYTIKAYGVPNLRRRVGTIYDMKWQS